MATHLHVGSVYDDGSDTRYQYKVDVVDTIGPGFRVSGELWRGEEHVRIAVQFKTLQDVKTSDEAAQRAAEMVLRDHIARS